MTTTSSTPTIVLIAGHWLGAWAWDAVLEHLNTDSSRAIAVTLPGLDAHDPERTTRTLNDQAEAILDIVAQHGNPSAILVAHSGANAPVSLVMDRRPELIHRVVWVDSGPVSTGSVFAPDFPEEPTELPLPSFDVLAQQASLEGLTPKDLEQFRGRAVPEPSLVLRQPVELINDARTKVPTTFVCCSMPSTQVVELAQSGHPMFADVAKLQHPDFIDLPTGHWPMWSRPRDLARIISSAASQEN